MGCYGVLYILEKVETEEKGIWGKVRYQKQILQRTENSFVYYVAHPWAGSSLTPSMRLVLSQWCGVKTTVTLIHPSSTVCQFSLPRRLETGKHYVDGRKTKTHSSCFKELSLCKAFPSMCASLPKDPCFLIIKHLFTSPEQNFIETPRWQP